jgi:hypothetical protein
VGVPQGKHPGFDLLFVEESSLAARKTCQSQGQRQQIQKLAVPTLDFARVTAHGWELRSEPIDSGKSKADGRRKFDRFRRALQRREATERFGFRAASNQVEDFPEPLVGDPGIIAERVAARPLKPAAAACISSGCPPRFRTVWRWD